MSNLLLQLKLLEDKQKRSGNTNPESKGYSVYYGWTKINKTRKKEAISIIFENDYIPERNRGFVSKMQNTVYVRRQTPDEEKDSEGCNRAFTEYSIFMNDKETKGSLELALTKNFLDDRNNVSEEERLLIKEALKKKYLEDHPFYKEPIVQLSLF